MRSSIKDIPPHLITLAETYHKKTKIPYNERKFKLQLIDMVNYLESLGVKVVWPEPPENDPMKRPIKAGTVIFEHGMQYRVLEDTTAHGCPLVEEIKTGRKFIKTIYQHLVWPEPQKTT